MKSPRSSLTLRRIADYCDLRLTPVLDPKEVSIVREYLADLLERNEYPPYRGSGLDIKGTGRPAGDGSCAFDVPALESPAHL